MGSLWSVLEPPAETAMSGAELRARCIMALTQFSEAEQVMLLSRLTDGAMCDAQRFPARIGCAWQFELEHLWANMEALKTERARLEAAVVVMGK